MTHDEIIRMAREAGLLVYHADVIINGCNITSELERFYKTAYIAGAAAEREECAKEAEMWVTMEGYEHDIAAAIRARGKVK